jgi:hypothetical protein
MPSLSATWILFWSFLLTAAPLAHTAESDPSLPIDLTNPAALQEATRVLAEEVKLASRPQTYVIVDLVDRAVVIKGRGVELHRLPIEQWSAAQLSDASATFRLQARPPVIRRKIEPATGSELPPISLDDMPTDFTLQFSPAFSLTVHPSASDDVWRWLLFKGREWWKWLKDWVLTLATGKDQLPQPWLSLSVTSHHAQSLAWTVTEGMPFLVRRTPPSP